MAVHFCIFFYLSSSAQSALLTRVGMCVPASEIHSSCVSSRDACTPPPFLTHSPTQLLWTSLSYMLTSPYCSNPPIAVRLFWPLLAEHVYFSFFAFGILNNSFPLVLINFNFNFHSYISMSYTFCIQNVGSCRGRVVQWFNAEALDSGWAGFRSLLCYFLAVWTTMVNSAFQDLGFLVC